MTVVYIKLARAIWLVDSRELNPRGIDIFPILEAIKSRYNFQVYPTKPEEANEFDPKGIVFMNGSFAAGSQRHMIVKATLYGDGLVVESALSTDFCEAFMTDTLTFMANQFGLTYRPEMVQTKLYVSEMIVRTEKDLSHLFAPLAEISTRLGAYTGQPFQPAGFGFGIDPAVSNSRRIAFSFEREINKPFSQKRYFSSAPLTTSQHEELLRGLEETL